MAAISNRTVGRLSLYRRLLAEEASNGVAQVYSHQLARLSGFTAAQVRRDLMAVGYTGTPVRGYDVPALINAIGAFLDPEKSESIALVGLGNLGRAILTYFQGRHPKMSIVAAFDLDPSKTGRVQQGCRCYGIDEITDVVRREGISTAIIAVPATAAQDVADRLSAAGVSGILNFAPTSLRTGPEVYVEHNDLTTAMERVAFFARARARKELSR